MAPTIMAAVEYPEISNMKDTEKQKQVNELIRQNALAIADVCPAGESGQALSVKATVESANLKRISITYRGEYKGSASGKSTRVFFTNAVDLETAENLRLSDYTDVYTIAGYIASGDYKLEAGAKYTKETWPEFFSFEKLGAIYISLPVPEELGSYVIVRYSPDNK